MTFLAVNGGPLGMGSALSYSDIYTVIAMSSWLLVSYNIPVAFLSYEMVKKQENDDGGSIGWVFKALGHRMGWLNATWDIVDTMIDNSIYPVLFAENAIALGIPLHKITLSLMAISIIFLINWIEVEGRFSIALAVIILFPYIILMFLTPAENMWTYPAESYDFVNLRRTFIVLIYRCNGYDMASAYAHKLKNFKESFFWNFVINTFGVYIMTITVFSMGTYYNHEPSKWHTGCFAAMAIYHGPVLKILMGLSGVAASLGILFSQCYSMSHMLVGLVKQGGPKLFSSTKFNMFVNCSVLIISVFSDLTTLMALSAMFNSFTLSAQVVSWLKITGYTRWRIFLAAIITINNIFVLLCLQIDCFVSVLSAMGLAVLIFVLTRRSISNEMVQ